MYEEIEKKTEQAISNNYYGQEKEIVNIGKKFEQGGCETYYVQEKQGVDKANQIYEIERLATPDDYNNEALYEEMTALYYVCINIKFLENIGPS